jgi:hypothetical protein
MLLACKWKVACCDKVVDRGDRDLVAYRPELSHIYRDASRRIRAAGFGNCSLGVTALTGPNVPGIARWFKRAFTQCSQTLVPLNKVQPEHHASKDAEANDGSMSHPMKTTDNAYYKILWTNLARKFGTAGWVRTDWPTRRESF